MRRLAGLALLAATGCAPCYSVSENVPGCAPLPAYVAPDSALGEHVLASRAAGTEPSGFDAVAVGPSIGAIIGASVANSLDEEIEYRRIRYEARRLYRDLYRSYRRHH